MLVVLLATALAVLFLLSGCDSDDGATETTVSAENIVSAETEQEINALIDDWYTAWNTADGQLALDLFAVDGRYVSLHREMDLGGWSGEELSAGVDRYGGAGAYDLARVGSPSIIERPDSYFVVARIQLSDHGRHQFETFNIVEEDGSLKIRFHGPVYPLGLMQLAEGMPPQIVNEAG